MGHNTVFLKIFFYLTMLRLLLLRALFASCRGRGLLSSCHAWPHCGSSCSRVQALRILWASVIPAGGLNGYCCPPVERRLSGRHLGASLLPWHVGSSQIRDPTPVSCIDKQIFCFFFTAEPPEKPGTQFIEQSFKLKSNPPNMFQNKICNMQIKKYTWFAWRFFGPRWHL